MTLADAAAGAGTDDIAAAEERESTDVLQPVLVVDTREDHRHVVDGTENTANDDQGFLLHCGYQLH